MTKIKTSIKSLLFELILAASIAYLFSLFAQDFWTWLAIILVLLLIWHHYMEWRLLKTLQPKNETIKPLTQFETLSPTLTYYNNQARREKMKSLRLLSRLNRNVQFLSEAIMVCGEKGDILWSNQHAQQLFDFYWHKKVEKNIFTIIFYPEFKTYFQKQHYKRPLVILTNNQRYIEITVNLYSAKTYLILARDVTQFISLLSIRQTFLTNLNHELRTPLTVLQGYIELLEFENANELQQKALHAIKEQTQRMTKLLQQLSLLVKIETADNKQHHPVNMSAIILSLQKNTALLKTEQQRIEFNIEPDLYVLGEETQLQSAVANLIYNAIKHSGEHSHIQISWKMNQATNQTTNKTTANTPHAIFSVTDNGIGIAPQHLPHLTERFYRVGPARSHTTGGSGLGLAIVKHALQQHNTRLNIESQENKGSCFWFVLGVVEQNKTQSPA
ncbi:phosphate regulon sensor histidine kinase PhoR [Lonepinella koalarum]|uniref:Phosphate regulon sensor protein PhoR n=1 Tax=Lonepinella koalarum TaxID=53417 RepID=A0A4R1L0P7_9PAST|nr:phosphate regulon sensor histidine kinase PhoR [Lonepinella koalarum]MDH2926308.1 PAS domain-containing sensor histidine kinase [Lonepinella koalarum]TCK71456.1 two-component system phosphate regulon sensor histidine kinase PhoR [Lonepinella koalarum]TFJ91166.1 phosphate regulon sensor histidine kinase PhoR [Lonepinella koalarum]